MTTDSSASYVIPNPEAEMRSLRRGGGCLILACIAVACALGYYRAGMEGVARLVLYGVFGGVGLYLLVLVPVGVVNVIRQNAVWKKHTYDWYRTTYSHLVSPSGRITCRHCGGTHTRAERMMNRTFMRAHSCAQCGKTLYFSPEDR